MRRQESAIRLAEIRAAFAGVVDAELAEKRRRLSERRQAEQERARHAAFWQGVALKAAADAAVTRVGGKA